MQISLTTEEVERYATMYPGEDDDRQLSDRMRIAAKRGFMDKSDLAAVATWKWKGGRTRQLVNSNTPTEVREITKVAFSARSERLRIGVLLCLSGVQWPMATVILHFAFPRRYPMLDRRAMATVGGTTIYNLERWIEYTQLCRSKAKELGVSMRELDRALWAVNKEATH